MPDSPPSPKGSGRKLAPSEAVASSEDLRDLLVEKARRSRRLAWLLDECIRIPGTDLRFGLDPIIGLIPYGGETLATLFGSVILGEARKKGLPFSTLARMGGNMILNAAVGALPLVGDLFSFWFKSNSRNYRLLSAYLESETGEQPSGGWWPLALIIGVLAMVVVLNVLAWVLFGTLVYRLGSAIFS